MVVSCFLNFFNCDMIFSFFFFFSRDQCRFSLKFPQAPFKKLNSLPLVMYMVHDYLFFGSTADFVIQKEHLGFLPDFAIFKRQRRRVEI